MVVKAKNGERKELRTNGQAMYDNEGNKLGAVISLHDITDLNKAKKKLHHLAYHDELTGLANRRLFHDLLKQNIRRAERNREKTAVLFLDLDNFKSINDRHGHDAGDRLLIQLASVLHQRLRESDILCRWGGDEFIIALPEIATGAMAGKVANKICQAVRKDLISHFADTGLSASIGVALYPEHGHSPDMLIRQADMAMYLAKQQGKNQVCLAPGTITPSGSLRN
jgi:diguanylate cyclase (GGDEF)-like protein